MGAAAAPLVGRADALALLDDAGNGLVRGEWQAVELVGEPGIGKTRLLAELATRASGREQLVLSGVASELHRDVPFWVFIDALDDYLRGLDPRLLDLLDVGVRTELGNVFPALSPEGRDPVRQHERYRTHRAVRDLLERLTATGPLVLLLDDLHWADPASIELLGSLLRRPPDAGVLVAVAARPGRLPPGLRAELDRAHRTEVAHPRHPHAAHQGRGGRAPGVRHGPGHGSHPVRRERREPVLPRAAGPVPRAPTATAQDDLASHRGPRRTSAGGLRTGRRAGSAQRQRTRRAARSGGGGRHLRA